MDAILKKHWLVVSLAIFGVAILIGDVDKYFPPGQLMIWLEVGIAVLGLGAIFVWAYWQSSGSGARKRAVKTDAANYIAEKQEKYS